MLKQILWSYDRVNIGGFYENCEIGQIRLQQYLAHCDK